MAVIKLTAKGAGAEIYVNPDHIVSFWSLEGGSEITVSARRGGDNVKWPVTQTPSEIAIAIDEAYRSRI